MNWHTLLNDLTLRTSASVLLVSSSDIYALNDNFATITESVGSPNGYKKRARRNKTADDNEDNNQTESADEQTQEKEPKEQKNLFPRKQIWLRKTCWVVTERNL